MTRVVVVGNGMAGARLVEEVLARDTDGRGDLTVLGAEPHPAYNRILLSNVVAGKATLDDIRLAAPRGAVQVRTGVTVTAVDRERRVVVADDGSVTPWDVLVLATGSLPFLPPMKGLMRDDGTLPAGALAFRTIDDGRALVAAAGHVRRAVVLGGGLLGIEAARGLAARGVDTEIVHLADHLMERQLDPAAGRLLARSLHDLGIGVRVGARAVAVTGEEAVAGILLDDGTTVEADLLVVSAGVRPNTALALDAGIAVERAILVDDTLRSVTDPRVFAIGECAQHADQVYGLVAPAWEQAAVVADIVTGAEPGARYAGSRQVIRLKATGIEVAAMGETLAGEDDAEVLHFHDPVRRTYKKLVIRDDRLVGAILLGDTGTVGTVTQIFDRGSAVPEDRLSLMFTSVRGATEASADPARIPDRATVCRCNGVTKGAITACWLAGARGVAEVAAATRATTGCGGCRDAVEGIVDWLTVADPAAPTPPNRPSTTRTKQRRPPMSRTLVVAGNGMVGHRLVEALRSRDAEGAWRVVVVGEEPRSAYDRVALSSYVTTWDADALALTPRTYDDPLVTLHLSDRVTGVDRDAGAVTTAAGRVIPYDALVLATGSRPFVPPVGGADLPGVFVYRTVEDLDALRRHVAAVRGAGRAPRGAVVGGGLLGLEAAGVLRGLDVSTTVVEFAPRLMPLQVDEGGGHALRRLVEQLGVAVRTGARTERLEPGPDGPVAQMSLADDAGTLDVDVVIFAAGVRPRDELAAACNLPLGPRGGVLVDAAGRTEDPRIWAVGECASVEGQVYGLVAPGYAMAEVVADRLVGGAATFPGADLSTKLKLLGVDVASFGDAFAATPGALELVWSDPVAGVYKKLVVSDDARTLLGGVLVGDASAYAGLRPLVGAALDVEPARLVLPEGGEAPVLSLPDSATVCSCHNVTRSEITCAISEHRLADVPAVKACTKAGTGCGSCVPLLKTILTECGVTPSRALCEHFEVSRAELFEIVRVTGIRTFSELVASHGRGRGCDICKPVVASILASLGAGHILSGEQAALQDSNDHHLANLQKDGTYSVIPRIPGGEITPEGLIAIGAVARDFGLYTKITGGQRIDLLGARVEQLPAIWRRLVDAGFESGHAYGKALRTVKSCVGSTWCRYGVQDSVGLAIALELRYRGLRAPHKIKAGVSGCARECAEARGKDFGVIATENGWNLYVAGNGGFSPRHAVLFAQDLDTETLVRYVDRFLMFYIRTADRLQRTATWIEAMDGGLDHLRDVVIEDSLGICAELDAAMARHVTSYSDEWRDTLDDPEKLARFASFVNAPDQGDPDIAFVSERGQPRPATPAERVLLVAGPRLEVHP